MGENYFYEHTVNNARAGNESFKLSRLETSILRCTKSKPKTEKKISREVKINLPIVSQIITDLMLKGLMERTRRRGTLFTSKEYFSTSIEGLIALESDGVLSQAFVGLKDSGRKILEDITSDSVALKSILGAVKLVLRMTKYVLAK